MDLAPVLNLDVSRSYETQLGFLKKILKDWRIAICIAIVFLTQYRYLVVSIFVPYASIRFRWDINQVEAITQAALSLSTCSHMYL